ncbi:cytochrome-c peroxidase [Pseudohongiella spirulinae]|uniref:cytochrome-c peroxidase n=1 Tax=Pseudohongiella spirulinae TaxID=1249552 RepID=UPI00147052AD|nr:cytochrome c peroxidase [Pseudohongiella spirulinae]
MLAATLLCSTQAYAADPAEPAWRSFQHALGEKPAIGSHADHTLANSVTRPVPEISLQGVNVHKFLLGNDLFHERRLSSDNTNGCVTCHAGPISGTDGRPVSFGVDRARGKFNALTTFNANLNFRQFWDGRSVTLADQAIEPIISELEMANTLENALAMLLSDQSYVKSFNAIYPDGVSINNMADAMAHFQTVSFSVNNSPFQRHLRGEPDQLDEQALRGWQTFQDIGCSSCHNGLNLGGNSYQRLGTMRAYYPEQREALPDDAGLATRTMRAEHLYMVKVPNLHNIAATLPYFHDGSVRQLEEAVSLMGRYQLGRELSAEDIADITGFLKSLTGRPVGLELGSEINQLGRTTEPVLESLPPERTHEQAYSAAAAAIEPLFDKLLAEMQRLAAGDVRHFDFVQAQHLELIRHARALQFPPSSSNNAKQSCLRAESEVLLTSVMALEWTIASYLQAQAMMGVLQAHLDTPAADSPDHAEIEDLLNRYANVADQSLAATADAAIRASAGKLLDCAL